MLLEDFFKHDPESNQNIVDYFYIATLSSWLVYNEFQIYEKMLQHFEEQEEYLICQGINQAIDKIDEIYNDRFDEATPLAEHEDGAEYTFEDHKRISRLIFEDVLKEIYEKQIIKFKENG